MGRKGLTLMELLVVISILATLAALLFPLYLSIRSRIDTLSCANQLRQIGLAIKMYTHDIGNETPYGMPPYLGELYPHYVRDKELLVCPAFRKAAPNFQKLVENVLKSYHGYPAHFSWSSYYLYDPRYFDDVAKENELELPIHWLSFSEVYAKRGDQTPIAYCDTHRHGCPFVAVEESRITRDKLPDCRSLADPNGPYVILRWGGSVNFVRKGSMNNRVILLTF